MSKKIIRCDNTRLKELLTNRDIIYSAIYQEVTDPSDEDLRRLNNLKLLQPFEKDLLYLCSEYPVAKVAEIYCVSKKHIYNQLHNIQNKLSK